MPDYFVAEDTTLFTSYYQEAASRGLITQFCFDYTDNNRHLYADLKTADEVLQQMRRERVIQQFINYCDANGLKRRNNMILRSQPLLEMVIHGSILYNFLDMEEYLKFMNRTDRTLQRAIELFEEGATTPTLPADDQATDKERACANPRPTIRHSLIA